MARNRFTEIKKYLHLADKLSKMAHMYKLLNAQLTQFGVSSELSIDESLVPYYGRHSCKMFITGKPIRFSYKLWYVCGSDGHPYHIIPYQGKEEAANPTPLGTRVYSQ